MSKLLIEVDASLHVPYLSFVTIEFEKPISEATNKHSTLFQKEEGRRASNNLDSITSTFMIRRLQKDVLKSMLPPRSEFLLFCRPSAVQCRLYKSLISKANTGSDPLPLLTKLRKLCTHPTLLDQGQNMKSSSIHYCSDSGKLFVLDRLLQSIRSSCPNDKVVVVSNFTSALAIIEEGIIQKRSWPYLRLDGSVEQASRQSLVDSFNRSNVDQSFIFLLSSKAGGCGLNLCRANRLVMVDGDWNPATGESYFVLYIYSYIRSIPYLNVDFSPKICKRWPVSTGKVKLKTHSFIDYTLVELLKKV